ncbi:MAG: lipid kinase [Marinilabiliales bacterium]|nr:MAG: lipid kinase [Marinilabiliales bacterium]
MKDWFVIVNPNAGRREGEKSWNLINSILQDKIHQYTSKFTKGKEDAIYLAKSAIEEGYKKIIAIGGDGTINEVVNGIFTQTYTPTTEILLGVIPVGTGNDWGRMFNIPTNYEGAITTIANGNTILQDVGKVSFYKDMDKFHRFFINIAGLGFDARVVKKSNQKKEKKKSGKLSYLTSLISSLLSHKSQTATVKIDSDSFSEKVFSMNVGICQYSGGGMKQVPFAIPDDGLFDLTVIKKLSKISVIRNVKKLYNGSFTNHKKVSTMRGEKILIESEEKIFLEVDGETMGHTPFEFEIAPKSLGIIVNPSYLNDLKTH